MNKRNSKSSRETLRRMQYPKLSLLQPGGAVSTVWFAQKKKNNSKLRQKMRLSRQSRSPRRVVLLRLLEIKLSGLKLTVHTTSMLIPKPKSFAQCSIKICKWQKRRGKRQNLRISSLRDQESSEQKNKSRRWKSTKSMISKESSISRNKNSRTPPPSLMRFSFRCFIISSLLSQCLMLSAGTKEGRSLIRAGPLDKPIKRRLSPKDLRESLLIRNWLCKYLLSRGSISLILQQWLHAKWVSLRMLSIALWTNLMN